MPKSRARCEPGSFFVARFRNLLNNDISQKTLVGPNLNFRVLSDPSGYGLRMRYNF